MHACRPMDEEGAMMVMHDDDDDACFMNGNGRRVGPL